VDMETGQAREYRGTGHVLGEMASAAQFLAGVDMTQLPGEVIGQILTGVEQVSAGLAAVRGKAVHAFMAQAGYIDFSHRGMTQYLIAETRVTRAEANRVRGLGTLHQQHPVLTAALAEQDVLSESFAREIAKWTSRLPEDCIQRADEILVEACRAGADLALLAELAAQIRVRTCGPDPEEEDDKLIDRSLRLETTLGGAGVLRGGLTPECAALLRTVLDALGKRQGKDDTRSKGERDHDALEAACRKVLAGKMAGQKDGKAYTAVVHVPFAHLLDRPGADVMVQAWGEQLARDWQRSYGDAHAAWMGKHAGETIVGGDGGAWLDGDRARAIIPDAFIVPVVTGTVAVEHLDAIVEIGAELHRLEHEHAAAAGETGHVGAGTGAGAGASDQGAACAARISRMIDLRRALIGKAVQLVSGPDRLASWLRQVLLGEQAPGPLAGALGGKSLPLDVGSARKTPPQLRLAVDIRDPRCQAPGCTQPGWQCEPHHLCHREHGGQTSLTNLENLCWWHHHVLIHQKGWSAELNGDGTSTLRRPDGTPYPNGPPHWPG
jgi:Domain of unknown function (DUF222)